MKCPHCDAWSLVKETRDSIRRRRECANGHRFTTVEVHVVNMPQQDRLLADAVVLGGRTAVEVAREYGHKSGSYVSKCVRRYYPQFNARVAGQRRRFAGNNSKATP